jgi:hypothetical protein
MQKEPKKLLLLDILEASAKLSKKQSFQEANATNICVTLLASLKVNNINKFNIAIENIEVAILCNYVISIHVRKLYVCAAQIMNLSSIEDCSCFSRFC